MKSRFGALRFKFQLAVIAHLTALAMTIGVFIWVMRSGGTPAVALVLSGLVTVQITMLLIFVSAQHRRLERFLDAIAFDDLALHLSEDDWGEELAAAANLVMASVRQARIDSEAQAHYLDVLIRHVPVAIISLRKSGDIALCNHAARHLFQLPRLRHVNDLVGFGQHLPERLGNLKPGSRQMLRASNDEQTLELKVSATEIRLAGAEGGDRQTLLAIENIQGELDVREMTAWRDLIRVLTHEIMNSVTPIASLARTIDSMIDDLDVGQDSAQKELIADMRDAVGTISRRSDGLVRFVEGYRHLTQIPQPTLSNLKVADLLDDVQRLFRAERELTAPLQIDIVPPSLSVSADGALLQQALINLVRNAALALSGNFDDRIVVRAWSEHGRVHMTINDNGHGISEDDRAQIFIPFFTTRKNGSGVGLTLVRQIMLAHGGNVSVQSKPDQGTTVRLVF